MRTEAKDMKNAMRKEDIKAGLPHKFSEEGDMRNLKVARNLVVAVAVIGIVISSIYVMAAESGKEAVNKEMERIHRDAGPDRRALAEDDGRLQGGFHLGTLAYGSHRTLFDE